MICTHLKVRKGWSLPQTCAIASKCANFFHTLCVFRFNGIPTVAYPGESHKEVLRRWVGTGERWSRLAKKGGAS